jgi:capsular polysaccharide biosynthesis protein
MEQRFTQSMSRRWWIFLLVFLITVGATLYLTMREAPVYRARGTYVNRLNSEITDARTVSSALDTLNRTDNLQGTYSEIAMSEMIKRRAGSKMGISNDDLRGLSVNSRVVPGSTVLEITVEGENLQLVRDFANVVGEETMAYVNSLYPSYQMTPLDAPTASGRPISPKLELNLLLALALGLFLGGGTQFFASWLAMRGTPAPVVQAEVKEGSAPVRMDFGALQKQFDVLRVQMEETQRVLHATQEDAQLISSHIKKLPKSDNNGSTRA